MFELGFLLLTLSAPEIPSDAERCMAEKKLWLAAPRFVERIEISDPHPRAAYQIHDQLEGADGHILVYPDTCRVVVLVLQPASANTPLERAFFISAPPVAPATSKEVEVLRRWLGVRALAPRDHRMSLALASKLGWSTRAGSKSELLRSVQTRSVDFAWGPREPSKLPRVALPTSNPAIETLLLFDTLARRPETSISTEGASGYELEVYAASGTKQFALRLVDQQRAAWLGLFDAGEFELEVHHVGPWFWFLSGTRAAPVLTAVGAATGEQRRLALETDGVRLRVALSPRGLFVGPLDGPSRVHAWDSLIAHLGSAP